MAEDRTAQSGAFHCPARRHRPRRLDVADSRNAAAEPKLPRKMPTVSSTIRSGRRRSSSRRAVQRILRRASIAPACVPKATSTSRKLPSNSAAAATATRPAALSKAVGTRSKNRSCRCLQDAVKNAPTDQKLTMTDEAPRLVSCQSSGCQLSVVSFGSTTELNLDLTDY